MRVLRRMTAVLLLFTAADGACDEMMRVFRYSDDIGCRTIDVFISTERKLYADAETVFFSGDYVLISIAKLEEPNLFAHYHVKVVVDGIVFIQWEKGTPDDTDTIEPICSCYGSAHTLEIEVSRHEGALIFWNDPVVVKYASIQLRRDNEAPEPVVQYKPAPDVNAFTTSDTVIWATWTDDTPVTGTSKRYTAVDSTEWLSGDGSSTSHEFTGGTGTYMVEFFATDSLGNTGTTGIRDVSIDKDDPVLSLSASPTAWTNDGVTVTAVASDVGSGISPDSLCVRTTEFPDWVWCSAASVSANTTVSFTVSDLSGRTCNASLVIENIDTDPPVITRPSVLADATWTAGYDFTASADDPAGSGVDVESWEWSLDGLEWKPGATATISAERTEVVRFRVRDLAGNTAMILGVARIDRTGPEITVDPGWRSGRSVQASAADAGIGLVDAAGWQWSLDGASWQPGDTALTTASGVSTVWFRAADALGNQSERECTVRIDDIPPEITPRVLTEGVQFGKWTSVATVRIDALFTDAQSGIVQALSRVDGGDWTLGVDAVLEVTGEGSHTVSFRAMDEVGRESSEQRIIMIDTTEPDLTLSAGVESGCWTRAEKVTVSAAADDGQSRMGNPGVVYRIGNGSWTAGKIAVVSAEGENTITFRAVNGAGISTEKSFVVLIDRTPPAIEGTADLYMRADTRKISVHSLNGSDPGGSGVSFGSWSYSIDGGSRKPLPAASGSEWMIPCGTPAHGTHTLGLHVSDGVGNVGNLFFVFLADLVPPVMRTITVRDLVGTVEDGAYSASPNLTVAAVAMETGMVGNITGYQFLCTEEWVDGSAPGAGWTAVGSEFEVRGLGDGIRYLAVRAIDEAGNASAPLARVLRVDTAFPGRPTLASPTHPRASDAREAVPYGDALFRIGSGTTGPSGIGAYRWTLWKGEKERSRGMAPPSAATIEILDLEDNRTDEFYLLRAWSMGGNGLESAACAEFRFRVDTAPPRELRVLSSSHSDPEAWYGSARASFEWNKPADMTGVRRYYTLLSESEVTDFGTLDGWDATEAQHLDVNLARWSGKPFGGAYLAVCAQDYAGNRQFDSRQVRWDTEAPSLPPLPDGETIGLDFPGSGRAVVVRWGDIEDGNPAAGPAHLEAGLDEIRGGSLVTLYGVPSLAPAAGSVTWEGLEPGTSYRVWLRAVDHAGNRRTYTRCFRSGGGEPEVADVAIPFAFDGDGFLVTGSRKADGTVLDAGLTVPAALRMRELSASTGEPLPEGAIPLDGVRFDGEELEEASAGGERIFSLTVAGFALNAYGLSFTPLDGLSLGRAVYRARMYESPVSRPSVDLEYRSVGLTFPPRILFLSTVSTDLEDLRFLSAGGDPPADAWLLEELRGTRLQGEDWTIASARLTGSEAYVEHDGVRDHGIPVADARICPEGRIVEAVLDGPFFLRTGGCLFQVRTAVIRDDRIVVLESGLVLPEGSEPREAEAANWSVGADGVFRAEAGFQVAGFLWTDAAGNRFEARSCEVLGGCLLVSGIAAGCGGTEFEYEGMRFAEDGPQWDLAARIPSFRARVHGFLVESDTARLTPEGVSLPTARLRDFPSLFGGGDGLLEGLEIRLADFGVVRPGSSARPFDLRPPYGAVVRVGRISLESGGLFAEEVLVPLPEGMADGNLPFSRWPLRGDGSFGPSAPLAEASLRVGGCGVEAETLRFDGAAVDVEAAAVSLDGRKEALLFHGLRIDASGVAREGTFTDLLFAASSGWTFRVPLVRLDGSGVAGCADLLLPGRLGSRAVRFPAFRFPAEGGCDAGRAVQAHAVRVNGRVTELAGIRLEGDLLWAESATVRVWGMEGEALLVVPDLAFRPDGSLAAAGIGAVPVEFLSENGFRVRANRIWYDGEGLAFSGAAWFPSGLGEDVAAPCPSMRLDAAGRLLAAAADGAEVTYRVAGWAVRAEGVSFDAGGLHVARSRIEIPGAGASFALPRMTFGAFGDMEAEGDPAGGIEVPLFGGGIWITEARLEAEGLAARCCVDLPPVLGGGTVFLDRVLFHPDGRIETEAAVPEVAFDLGSVAFLLQEVRLDEAGLTVGEAAVTLPQELEGRRLHARNLRIGKDGSFELGDSRFDPFTLWGYTLEISRFSLLDHIVSLEGAVTLPAEFPAGLGGRTLAVEELSFTEEGSVLAFHAFLSGEVEFPLTGDWRVAATDLGIERDTENGPWLLAVEKGTLLFPPEIPVEEVSVEGLRLDPMTGAFSFKEISISGVEIEEYGMTFLLSRLAISDSFDMRFSGSVTLPAGLPRIFAGKVLEVGLFEIHGDGTIGDVEARLAGIEGPLFEAMVLSGGVLEFVRDGQSLWLGCSGDLAFADSFPGGLAGRAVHLSQFRMDLGSGSLSRLEAASDPLTFRAFDAVDVEEAVFSVSMGSGSPEASVSGTVVLPPSLPGLFAGQRVRIAAFRMGLDGTVREMDVALSIPGEHPLFDGVLIRNASIGAALDGTDLLFRAGGTLSLSSAFPEGLAGTSLEVATLCFDGGGALRAVDASVQLPEVPMYGEAVLRGGRLSLRDSGGTLLVSIAGEFVLPQSFPKGLAGLVIGLQEFTFTTTGGIRTLLASVSGIRTSLFDVLALEDGSVTMSNGDGSELLFQVGGDLVLPESLPEPLSLLRLRIQACTLSSRTGLVELRAGLASPIRFGLFAGITAGCDSLILARDGFSASGDLLFPQDFPTGLAGMRCALSSFAMRWDGTVTEIAAGIASASMDLSGFHAEVKDLLFHPDRVTLGSCVLSLPACVGGASVGILNASFDGNGAFHGELATKTFAMAVGGFTLSLDEASLDCAAMRLRFGRTELLMPAFLGGGTLALHGVGIGPAGLTLSGGAFRLPDFVIAGGLGFRDVSVDFSLAGGEYGIEGGGTALVPGAGAFGARVSFTNVSAAYPWGLRRAQLSYEVAGPGLPLGATGLYLSGIRGGLAFGPPDEVPPSVQGLFGGGTRLALGLTMRDLLGYQVHAEADVWVDVTDWDWAFRGQVSVFCGYLTADMTAALVKGGFRGEVLVNLKLVEGRLDIAIGPSGAGSPPTVSGTGTLRFGLAPGSLIDTALCQFPTEEFWLPGVHAEFGRFQGKEEGFRAYVDLPVFGNTGVFIGRSGAVVFGSISEYVLERPPGGSIAAPRYASSVPSRTVLMDRVDRSGASDLRRFAVPGRSVSARSAAVGSPTNSGSETERLVFAVGYKEGDPVITAVSPSGARWCTADPDVEVTRTAWGLLFAILDPEPGDWSLEVDGLLAADGYEAVAFGKARAADVQVSAPAFAGESVDVAFRVAGSLAHAGGGSEIEVRLCTDRDDPYGWKAWTGPASDGDFAVEADASAVPEGEYLVRVGVRSGDAPERTAFAPGSVAVRHPSVSLLPVGDLIASDNGDGGVELRFADPNAGRASGFLLILEDLGSSRIDRILLGYLTDVTIPGFEAGDRLRMTVIPLDAAGREGPPSRTASLTMGAQAETGNRISLSAVPAAVDAMVGIPASASFALTASDPQRTGTAADWAVLRVTEPVEGVTAAFAATAWDVSGGCAVIQGTVLAGETVAPGTYGIGLMVRNAGNRANAVPVDLAVRVSYPEPEISGVFPDSWNGRNAADLEVDGRHFLAGTRLYLDDGELPVTRISADRLRTVVPAGIAAGAHSLRVVGPGGGSVSTTVAAVEPHYVLQGWKTRGVCRSGGAARFFFSIEAADGFGGKASFRVETAPEGWDVALETLSIGPGEVGSVRVEVPASASPGEREIVLRDDQGDLLSLELTASEEAPDPSLAFIWPSGAFVGDQLAVYGSGLGGGAAILLGGLELPVLEASLDEVLVSIPAEASSGLVRAARGGAVSNGLALRIKEEGFSLYGPRQPVRMQEGDSRTLQLAVAGAGRRVDLSVTGTDVSAALEKPWVLPNAVDALELSVPRGTPRGTYPITVHGASGHVSSSLVVPVLVGDAFRIATESLADAMEDAAYRIGLATEFGDAPVSFTLAEGSLPPGITLSSSGLLRGTPTEAGSWSFLLGAADAEGRAAGKRMSLAVAPNGWGQEAMDGGRTRWNPVRSPADSRIGWTSGPVPDARAVLTGRERVYVVADGGVTCLQKAAGTVLWKAELAVERAAAAGSQLFLLGADGVLRALDGRYGGEYWRREGIRELLTDGVTLCLGTGEGMLLLDAATGALSSSLPDPLPPGALLAWSGAPMRAEENALLRLGAPGWAPVFRIEAGRIGDFACDAAGTAVLSSDGRLSVMDAADRPVGTVETGIDGEAQVLLLGDRVLVAGPASSASFDRLTLERHFTSACGGTAAAAALEKYFLADGSGLCAVNAHDGRPIWRKPGAWRDLALAGGKLYALDAEGRVSCFDAADNLLPPVTFLEADPAAPDGRDGWYVSRPTYRLDASDAETYGSATWTMASDGLRFPYEGPVTLPEGTTLVRYCSQDSGGLREAEKSREFRVDSRPPEVQAAMAGTEGLEGIFLSDAVFSLSASDAASDIAHISVRRDGGAYVSYEGAFAVCGEGAHRIDWRVEDHAGNAVDGTESFTVDQVPPRAEAHDRREPGLTAVYLDASDAGSGVEGMEYVLRGSQPIPYRDPIVLTAVGKHRVKYRARDRAGRWSAWGILDTQVMEPERVVVTIVSPEPGAVLSPLMEVPLIARTPDAAAQASVRWQMRLSDGFWMDAASDRIVLPMAEGESGLELRAMALDALGRSIGTAQGSWRVVDRSRVELTDPAPGWSIAAGAMMVVRWRAYDVSGTEVPPWKVDWAHGRDGEDWSPVAWEGLLRAPDDPGPYRLRAAFPEAPGRLHEETFRFDVGGRAEPVRVLFGGSGGGERSLGEKFGERTTGMIHGFTCDHRSRGIVFRLLQPGAERMQSAILLAAGERFRFLTGTGRLRASLRIGPVEDGHAAEVRCQGKVFRVPAGPGDRMALISFETEADSGILEILGSPDLPLAELVLERILPGSPEASEETRVENVEISRMGSGTR